jgi:hypothetical protein
MPASGAGLVVVVRLAALMPSSFGLPIRLSRIDTIENTSGRR